MRTMTTRADLTEEEFLTLCAVVNGQMSRNIAKAHRVRLVELRLIQDMMGVLIPTPEGRIVAHRVR
jgi:hypothetical protein